MRKSSPQLIGDVLRGVVEHLSQTKGKDSSKIFSAWTSSAGKRLSRHAKPVSLHKGTLQVFVDDSAWLYQANLEREKLLESLQEKMGAKKIQKIRFRIGKAR